MMTAPYNDHDYHELLVAADRDAPLQNTEIVLTRTQRISLHFKASESWSPPETDLEKKRFAEGLAAMLGPNV